MSGYVKLFGSILDSTVWDTSPETRVVWITLLAMADRDGIVEAAVPGLAKRAGVTLPKCEEALALFRAPDPHSRTKTNEGRRLEDVDGGWRLLNYEAYRDKATALEKARKNAERQARFRDRERERNAKVTPVTPVGVGNALRSISDPSASAAADHLPSVGVKSARAPRSGKPSAWRRFPADYEPGEAERALAAELRVDIGSELAAIRDHEFAKPKTDPAATFRTWLRNAAKFGGGRAAPPAAPKIRLLTHAEHAADAARQVLPDWARD